ncbi:hypothetical protein HZH68_009388 [Vespula germanica]|uniref:Uncharacterized protein n=1 Tax=Vespula germanica TaxID=30212 RepID=A0A834JVC6_VESGE|nr:hypothetical protein HZH68_009388 [Vespula germanica]
MPFQLCAKIKGKITRIGNEAPCSYFVRRVFPLGTAKHGLHESERGRHACVDASIVSQELSFCPPVLRASRDYCCRSLGFHPD